MVSKPIGLLYNHLHQVYSNLILCQIHHHHHFPYHLDHHDIDRTIINKLKKIYKEPRKGDVLHSQADITKIKNNLKYTPTHDINQGLEKTVSWFIERRDQL